MAHSGFAFSAVLLLFGTLGCSPRFDSRGDPSDQGKTVAEWISLSKEGADSDRAIALGALAQICKDDRSAGNRIIPAIVESLNDKSHNIRGVAVCAVLVSGAQGAAVGDRIIELLGDNDALVRRLAVETIPHVGVPANKAVPRLAEMLDDDDYNVRVRAAQSLATYGTNAKVAIPRLEAMSLNEEIPKVRAMINEALGKIRGAHGE